MKKQVALTASALMLIVWVIATGYQDKTIPPSLVGTWVGTASNTHITPENAPMPLTLFVTVDEQWHAPKFVRRLLD